MWPDLMYGLLGGTPAAIANYWLARRSLLIAEKLPGIAGVNVIMKWSLFRLAVAAAALLVAMRFGPYVVIGVFCALVVEMGAYIWYLWRYGKKHSR